MNEISLYNMIKYLQNGTNLHIGVLFFGNYGNKMCELPNEHLIHSSAVCEEIKTASKISYKRCFKCRNLALRKALQTKKPFGGMCINGIYEYTHPVVIDDDVACVVFIGNILSSQDEKIKNSIGDKHLLLDTLEENMGYEDCRIIAKLLESHICMLLEKYTDKTTDVNPLVENIKNYIFSNLEFDINISHIAEFFHYNKLYIARLFKKETNMNIRDYINIQRIEKARKLLETTDETIISISNKVGFNNVTYFNRLFKNIIKITPTQYREKNDIGRD